VKSFDLKLFSVSALLLSAFSGCGGGKDSSPPPPTAHVSSESSAQACQDFVSKLPAEYFHDYVTVPEDPSDPNGNQIKVFYYGRLTPGKTPIVFFNGGPTSNSWSSYRVLTTKRLSDPAYADLPFIFIDQRGTGCSDSYPSVQTKDDLPKLALYGSAGIVSDAEAVRKHLIGKAPWKIFGQSYGGMIVHRYIQMAPDSIVSATSHGFALTTDPLLTMQERIDSQNRVLNDYLVQYSDDAVELQALNNMLTPTTCFSPTTGDGNVCGKEVLSQFSENIGFVDEWPWMHNWLVYLAKSTTLSQQWIDKVVFASTSTQSYSAGWADGVIWHNEMNFASTTHANCQTIYDNLKTEKSEDQSTWLLDECQYPMQKDDYTSSYDFEVQSLPQNMMSVDDLKQILTTHPRLKLYLYSGGVDPYSPVEIFADELRSASSLLTYSNFPNTGHDGFYSEDLVWQNLVKN
jgi:pimeloyl-ACP methyl ester carboxylesterase